MGNKIYTVSRQLLVNPLPEGSNKAPSFVQEGQKNHPSPYVRSGPCFAVRLCENFSHATYSHSNRRKRKRRKRRRSLCSKSGPHLHMDGEMIVEQATYEFFSALLRYFRKGNVCTCMPLISNLTSFQTCCTVW